jgi:phage shock protein E
MKKLIIATIVISGAFFLGHVLIQPKACGAVCGAQIGRLTVGDFYTLSRQPDVIILDVRTPEEFAGGHIRQAVNVDIYNQAQVDRFLSSAAKDKPYLIYCRTDNRSGQMRELMAARGFTHVVNLIGGIQAWQTGGYSLDK